MKQRGFTLIELLVGLILSGVLAQLAAPSFKGLESQRRQSAAETLAAGLRYARTEAVARNRTVVIHALDNDWSLGWRVVLVNGRGHLDEDNPVLLERQDSGRIPIVQYTGPDPDTLQRLGRTAIVGGGRLSCWYRACMCHGPATEPVSSGVGAHRPHQPAQ